MVSPSPVIKAFYLQAVCCFFFSKLWIYLHLYIVKEGFSFFLMNIFHLLLIRYGRGGRGKEEIRDNIQIFFHNRSDLSLQESGRSTDICVP